MYDMFKNKGLTGILWKPKCFHSLEHLKYLCHILDKNKTINESNRTIIVETLRSIAELLIWGDQNDGSIFDYFLERNMFSNFLTIMDQKCGNYVCIQLLQTLNILFENIRNETSIYFLLSNNHVNSIILHKFDFSDEEVMAYYISFLKTLSFRLNKHTVHFFFNEQTKEFPLYTEAIKFFMNNEGMVRIAVRTLTLNVYKVEDEAMQSFIIDHNSDPYFANLVWFIGNNIFDIETCFKKCSKRPRCLTQLKDLMSEHLDTLYYVNDILFLKHPMLNQVLTNNLMNRLIIPLHIYSMRHHNDGNHSAAQEQPVKVGLVTALFLICQVLVTVTHAPLLEMLTLILLAGDENVFLEKDIVEKCSDIQKVLENRRSSVSCSDTLEEKCLSTSAAVAESSDFRNEFFLDQSPFLKIIFDSIECSSENDCISFLAISILYCLYKASTENIFIRTLLGPYLHLQKAERMLEAYNSVLMNKLLGILSSASEYDPKVRMICLDVAIGLIKEICLVSNGNSEQTTCILSQNHVIEVERAEHQSILLLRTFFKSEEIFLDIFEDELRLLSMSKHRPTTSRMSHVLSDITLLMPPTWTPLNGIELSKRLPCGNVERTRHAIRTFLRLRQLSLQIHDRKESKLPLFISESDNYVHVNEVLDLSNADILAVTVVYRDGTKQKCFLVVDVFQIILVEPDSTTLGWGVATFVGFLQNLEVFTDTDDTRSLQVTIHHPENSTFGTPILSAIFTFDDHIRCIAAKQRLIKGRNSIRQLKMNTIAELLNIPDYCHPLSLPFCPDTNINKCHKQSNLTIQTPYRPLFSSLTSKGPGAAASLVNNPSGLPDVVVTSSIAALASSSTCDSLRSEKVGKSQMDQLKIEDESEPCETTCDTQKELETSF